jgi:hypothetical protein
MSSAQGKIDQDPKMLEAAKQELQTYYDSFGTPQATTAPAAVDAPVHNESQESNHSEASQHDDSHSIEKEPLKKKRWWSSLMCGCFTGSDREHVS